MSAYGHLMKREYSAHSLSSRGGSERDSRYVMESGFYMTSYACDKFFIAALVTVGVFLVTLVITLTVTVQSCENRSAGLVETEKSNLDHDTCKTLALHAELNNLDASQLPVTCRTLAIRYIEEGQYARDLNSTFWVVEDYFKKVTRSDDGLDVFFMDIDDVLIPSPQYANLSLQGKPGRHRNATIEHLVSAGYRDGSLLLMRSEDELHMDSQEYFSRKRAALRKQGFCKAGAISSRYDALTGPYSAGLIFKFPNPSYYHSYDENQNENTDIPV